MDKINEKLNDTIKLQQEELNKLNELKEKYNDSQKHKNALENDLKRINITIAKEKELNTHNLNDKLQLEKDNKELQNSLEIMENKL